MGGIMYLKVPGSGFKGSKVQDYKDSPAFSGASLRRAIADLATVRGDQGSKSKPFDFAV